MGLVYYFHERNPSNCLICAHEKYNGLMRVVCAYEKDNNLMRENNNVSFSALKIGYSTFLDFIKVQWALVSNSLILNLC
jgi:hypothetical protein